MKVSEAVLIQIVTTTYFICVRLNTLSTAQYIYYRFAIENPFYQNMSQELSLCLVNKSDPVFLATQDVQKETARWTMYLSTVTNAPSVIVCLFLGANSDYYGRRWLHLLSNAGIAVFSLIYGINSKLTLPITVLFAAHAVDGLAGSACLFTLASYLRIADQTKSDKSRTLHFVITSLLVGVVWSIVDFVCGYILQYLGFFSSFFMTTGIALLNFVSIVNMKESNINKQPNKAIISYIKTIFKFYIRKTPDKKRTIYILILFSYSLVLLIISGRANVDILYCMNSPFCWTSVKIGVVNGTLNLIQSFISLIAVKMLQIFIDDVGMGLISLAFLILSMIVQGIAANDIYLYAAGVLRFPMFMIKEILRSVVSKMTPENEQGAAMSSFFAIQALETLIGILLFNYIYEVTIMWYRGTVFLMFAALFFMAGCGLTFVAGIKYHQKKLLLNQQNDPGDI